MSITYTAQLIDSAEQTPAYQARRPIALPVSWIKPTVIVATLVVICLGILREFVIDAIGTETVLQDLRHIALDAEQTLAAWYSSTLMFFSALLLFVSGLHARRAGMRYAFFWFILAAVFVLFAMDETISVHEVAIKPLRSALDTSGALYFAWVIPGSIFVALFGLLSLPFLASLPKTTAASFILAGGLFVGGALGMEFVGGHFVSSEGWTSLNYILAATIEESLEMIGLSVFVIALIAHLRAHQPQWTLD